MKTLLFSFFLLFSFLLHGQQTDPSFKKVLYKNRTLKPLLKHAQNYGIQIIYTPISQNKAEQTLYFNYQPESYFYPASTIKLPAVLVALEKLNRLGLDKALPYSSKSKLTNYPSVHSSEGASIKKYIQKILLVSDNDAFNRLYDFIGKDDFNDALHQKGLINSKVNHRLSIRLSQEENNYTPAINIGDLYAQDAKRSNETLAEEPIPIGKAYYKRGELIHEAMDFGPKNKFDLLDQHLMLMDIFNLRDSSSFDLKTEDLAFVKDYMSRMPRNGGYEEGKYPDNYSKFLMFGDSSGRIPDHVKIFNKIGAAYGFLIDNALIEDNKNDVKFLLSAVIYTNENQTLNDNTYDYEQVGFPFLGELGRHIHSYMIRQKGKD